MKILLAAPRGFCAGVNMAVKSVERMLELFGPPLIVYHEIIHNNWVVKHFEKRGVVFIQDIDEAPVGSRVLFSAHGVSPEVRRRAAERRLLTVDATCPLVKKVHTEVERFVRQGHTVFLIGHAGHDEVVGTLGVAPGRIQLVETLADVEHLTAADPDRTAFVMQTTLSVDDAMKIVARLRERFPRIQAPAKDDICYATQNRQEAIKQLAPRADVVLIVGSPSSSNSQRLTEIARDCGRPAVLIDRPEDLDLTSFHGDETVLVSAGASGPEHLVQRCVQMLKQQFDAAVEEITLREEHTHFALPVELDRPANASSVAQPARFV